MEKEKSWRRDTIKIRIWSNIYIKICKHVLTKKTTTKLNLKAKLIIAEKFP